MAILDELLVRLGIDADELAGGTRGAAEEVETALAGVGDAGRQAGQEAARGVQAVADSLDEVGASAEQAADGAEQAADGAEQSLRGVAAAAAGAAAGAAFMGALSDAMDATSATTRLKNQLDLTSAEAGRAGDIAGGVFSAGFGGSIGEVDDALGGVISNIGGMGAATDAELAQMTKAALALADTFEFDVAESTAAVGTLMKSGMVKDGTEALDLLTAAARKLPSAFREELPALTKEYGEFFDQLGFTGPDMMGLLAEAAKNPVFELDKVGDAIKELSLRLADTAAVTEPLKDLGLDVEEIQGLVNEGKGTQAFDQIVGALKDVDDQTERTALQAALFGGPGEDMGNTLLKLSADGAASANGLADVAGASKDVTDSMEASPAQQLDSIMRTLSATLGEALAPALSAVAGFAAEHPALFKGIAIAVTFLAVALAIGAAAQWAMNAALLANPVMWVVIAVIALIAAIVAIAVKTTWFQDLWSAMTSGVGAAWDWLWALLSAGFGLLGDGWDWLADHVGGAVGTAIGFILGLGAVPGIVGGFFARMGSAAAGKIGDLIGWVRGIPGRVRSAVGDLGSLLYGAGRAVIRGLVNGVMSAVGWLGDKLAGITAMIPSWKGPMAVDLRLLEPSGAAIMSGLVDGIDGGEAALQRRLAAVTASIPANISTAVNTAAGARGGPPRMVLDVRGGEDALVRLIRSWVREGGDGSAESFFSQS